MSSQFESFIQLELPKRPYLLEDVPQESIIVRKGAGPRQLSGLLLSDNQTMIMRQGKLIGVDVSEFGSGDGNPVGVAEGFSHTQTEPAVTWQLDHNKENRNVVITVLDENHEAVLYDSLLVESNRITISFYEPQAGFANVVFV